MNPGPPCAIDTIPLQRVNLGALLSFLAGETTSVLGDGLTLFCTALTSITRTEFDVSVRVNYYSDWCISDVQPVSTACRMPIEFKYSRREYNHEVVLQVVRALSTCSTLTHLRFFVNERPSSFSQFNDLTTAVCKILYNSEKLISLQLSIGPHPNTPNIYLVGRVSETYPFNQESGGHISSTPDESNPLVRSLKVQLVLTGSTARVREGDEYVYKWETNLWLLLLLSHNLLKINPTQNFKNVLKVLVLGANIKGPNDFRVTATLVQVVAALLSTNPGMQKLSFIDSFCLDKYEAEVIAKSLRNNSCLKELCVQCYKAEPVRKLLSPLVCNQSGHQDNLSLRSLKITYWNHQGSIMKELAKMLETNTTLTHVELYPSLTTPEDINTTEHMWMLMNRLTTNTSLQHFNLGVGFWEIHRVGTELQPKLRGVPQDCWRNRKPPKEYTVLVKLMEL